MLWAINRLGGFMKKLLQSLTLICFVNIANAQSAYILSGDSTLFVFNIVTNTISDTITVGASPGGVSVSSDGSKVYVANALDYTVSVIKTATNSVLATILVGNSPGGLAVSPDGSKVFVTNTVDNTVSVINTATNTVSATIPVLNAPVGITVSPDGSKVYVANEGFQKVSVISTSTNTVSTTIQVGVSPYGVAVSPDGSTVYVTNYSDNTVSVINTATNTVSVTIPVGSNPSGITICPDGSKVYVSNNLAGTVSVINTATNTVLTTINCGGTPGGISVTPDGSMVFVTSYNNKKVKEINTATNTISATINFVQGPHAFGNFISIFTQLFVNSVNLTMVSCNSGNDGTATANVSGGTPPYTYLWNTVPTQTTQTATNLTSGSYTVIVSDSNSMTTTASVTITEPALILINNPQTICSGESYIFNGNNYNVAGNYYDTLTAYNGCDSIIETPLTLNATPQTPVITILGDEIISNISSGNQWYLNDTIIPGANDTSYTILSDGSYYDIITQNGCSSDTSNIITVNISNLNENYLFSDISIYPNPAINTIIIKCRQKSSINIINIQGQTILQQQLLQDKTDINISGLAKGVYILRINNNNKTKVTKFLKE
jgi:YVTN family beta-propeller protein